MNKTELLNSIIKITRETGQGFPGRLGRTNSEVNELLDELLSDGKIKKSITKFNYLDDEEWILPTDAYNVWEDEDKRSLTFIRLYLGHKDLGLVKQKDVIGNVDFMKGYSKWLEKNEASLIALGKMEDVEDDINDLSFTASELKWIKTRSWYKENKKVSSCLSQSKNSDDDERIRINNKLLSLYESDVKRYGKDIEKANKDIASVKKHKKTRRKLNTWLATQDKKELIQNVLS